MSDHRIEWDHEGCDHQLDEDGDELGWCSPTGRVICSATVPEPLAVNCRVICNDAEELCIDGFSQCDGDCAEKVREREDSGCWCLAGGPVEPNCPTVTHPFPPHPAEPHCAKGHLLEVAPDCQVELFLNEEPSLLNEHADRQGRGYIDGPIDAYWTGDGVDWEYVSTPTATGHTPEAGDKAWAPRTRRVASTRSSTSSAPTDRPRPAVSTTDASTSCLI